MGLPAAATDLLLNFEVAAGAPEISWSLPPVLTGKLSVAMKKLAIDKSGAGLPGTGAL